MTLAVLTVPPHQASQLLRMVRLCAVLVPWLLLLLFLQRRYALITRFLAEKSSSTNLAMARIATMLALLWQVRYSRIERFATLDHALLVPFGVWGKLAIRLPLSHLAVTAAYVLFVPFACCALVGFRARIACAITAFFSLYFLCIPQLTGKVDHDYGHLVVFSFLLALAPSADALSLDAFLLGRRTHDPGLWLRPRYARVYATALQSMMLYIGIAYFFPGLWKWVAFGAEWFHPAHLHFAIAEMWDGIGMTPLQLWVLGHPALLFAGAATTIVFELGVLLLLLSPRTRPFLILIGIPFHNLTFLLMGIPFTALQALYVVFFDWSPLFARLAAKYPAALPSSNPAARRASPALKVFCLAALAGMVLTGSLRKMFTWPINCYPTFDSPQSPTLEIRTLQAVDTYGATHNWTLSSDPVMRQQFGNERWKAMLWYDFGASPDDHARTRAALRLWLKYHPSPPLVEGTVLSTVYLRNDSLTDMNIVSSRPLLSFKQEDLEGK